ncbi:MAG: molybdate ABC transporter substrate-binding protein [Ignavibacteriaceae bacterium]
MKYLFLILYFIFIIPLSENVSAQRQITIAAAANVQYAMEELKAEFKEETGIDVSVVIGSSGQLTAQIKEGAPYDIFISADMKYPLSLYSNKDAVDSPKVYAEGSLVIWTMRKGIRFDSELDVLLSDKVSKIAAANPRTAPYGIASIEALKHFGIYDKSKNKLIYGESISSVNQFIYSKAVEAGFTAKSVVLSPKMKGKGKWMEIEHDAYKPIKQGCVILKYGYINHKKESKIFYNFLFSAKAKSILSNFGYIVK